MDVAAQYANRLGGQDAYTKQEARWLLWKIDLRIIPVLFFNVSLPAVDKVTTCKFVPFIEKP
jgi:MFS transporter, ACS family, allantoate permease